tara:strand:+ start:1908 stop:2099 length:192 start_codon:yes stop_codon:yes gene_type:complete
MDWQINVNGMSASAVARSLNAQWILGKRGQMAQGVGSGYCCYGWMHEGGPFELKNCSNLIPMQ